MDTKGKYVFTGCAIRFLMHTGNIDSAQNFEFEYNYPEGSQEDMVEIRANHIAYLLQREFGLKMISSVDNYFTFDISENIPMHHSVWYTCNVVDNADQHSQVFIKITNTNHFGSYIQE